MAHRTVDQLRRRRQFERLIGLAAPALDLVLWTGDRISRVMVRETLPSAEAPRHTPIGGGERVPEHRRP